jgi:tetratricopeptide (TPR) repeat protein
LCKKHNDTDAIRQLIKTHKQGTPLYFYHCAYDAFQSKKYDQAHKYLALVLAKNPQHEQAHQLAIRMHLLQKNTSAALHGYQRWLSADPNNKELILTIMNLRKGKVPPRFVQTIIRSCAQKSPTLWICFALADLLYEQQDYKEARHWYEKARQSIGNGMSPLLASKLDYQIASTWHGQKQFDNARLATEKALQQKVVYPSAYNLYALTLIAGNHSMTKAHEAIDKALMASPYNPAYLDTRGLIYCTQKQWTKACTVFDTALQYSPGNPVIVRHLRMAQSALIPE